MSNLASFSKAKKYLSKKCRARLSRHLKRENHRLNRRMGKKLSEVYIRLNNRDVI